MTERLYMRDSNVLRFERIRTSRDVATYPDRIYDLTILLRNLAVAGALCAAFADGWNVRFLPGQDGSRKPWRPDCGREVPR